MRTPFRHVLLLLFALLIQSCGGGGGGSSSNSGTTTPTPLTVDASSFVNKGATDLANFLVPDLSQITTDGYTSLAATLAVADFQQLGQYSAFVVGTKLGATPFARAYFLKYDTSQAKWIDVSGLLFASDSDRVTCNDPRQGLVTKFNADTKPDVYLVCAGGGLAGVPQNAFITRAADGKYVKYETNFQANASSASIADINADQFVDVVTNHGGLLYRVFGAAESVIGTSSWLSTMVQIQVTHTPMPSYVRNVFLIPRGADRYLLVGGQGSGQNVVTWYQGDTMGAFDTTKSRSFVMPSVVPPVDYLFDYVEQEQSGTIYGYLYTTSNTTAAYLKVLRIEGPLANSSWPVASADLYKYGGTPLYASPTGWTSRVVIRSGKLVPYDAGCANNPVNAADQRCTQSFVQDWTNFAL
jgi:hypothetical protein